MRDSRRPRKDLSVAIYRLGEEPDVNWLESTTAEERFELVGLLSARMAEMTGRTASLYSRSEVPVRIIRAG